MRGKLGSLVASVLVSGYALGLSGGNYTAGVSSLDFNRVEYHQLNYDVGVPDLTEFGESNLGLLVLGGTALLRGRRRRD